MKVLKYNPGFEAQNRNVLNGARSIRLDDVLQVGLKERPFVDLDAVVSFKHGCVVRLIGISLLLQRFDIVEAILTEPKGGHELVVVARGNQALIDESGMKIEWQNVVIFRRVGKKTE